MSVNRILRFLLLAGLFAVPFIPLVISTEMFFPFITGKNFAFRIIMEILLGLYLVLAYRDASFRPQRSFILYGLFVLLTATTIADIVGASPYKSFWSNYERMEGLVSLLHLGAFFVIVPAVLSRENMWRRFFEVSLGVAVFMGLYGLMQLAGELTINQGGVRVDGTFGNAAYLAVYMLFNLFFLAFLFASERKRDVGSIARALLVGAGLSVLYPFINYFGRLASLAAQYGGTIPEGTDAPFFLQGNASLFGAPFSVEKTVFMGSFLLGGLLSYLLYAKNHRPRIALAARLILYALAGALMLCVLYHTATRGAILGLLGGGLVAAILIAPFERERPKFRAASLGVLAALLIIIGGFFAARDAVFVQESMVLSRFSSISLDETTTKSRFMVWGMALDGFKERPIFGWGQENFSYVFAKYYNPGMYAQEPWFDRAHNVLFDWLIAGGIVGLLAYLSLFAAALYYLWWKRGPLSVTERSIITGLLAAYFFQNLFVFDNLVSYILFLSVLGYLHTLYAEGELVRPQGAASSKKSRQREPADPRELGVGTLAVALTVSLIFFINYGPMRANTALIDAMGQYKEGPAKNLEYFKRAYAHESFGDHEITEQVSRAAISIAGSDASEALKKEYYELAREKLLMLNERVPEDARTLFFTGSFFTLYGNNKDGLAYLLQARDVSPKKQNILIELGLAYLRGNDLESALPVLREAYELEPEYQAAGRFYAAALLYGKNVEEAERVLLAAYGTTSPADTVFIEPYLMLKRYDRVAEIWNAYIEQNPGELEPRIRLAAAYVKLGKRAQAIEEIERAMELYPDFKEQGESYIREIKAGRVPQ